MYTDIYYITATYGKQTWITRTCKRYYKGAYFRHTVLEVNLRIKKIVSMPRKYRDIAPLKPALNAAFGSRVVRITYAYHVHAIRRERPSSEASVCTYGYVRNPHRISHTRTCILKGVHSIPVHAASKATIPKAAIEPLEYILLSFLNANRNDSQLIARPSHDRSL